MGEFVVLGVGRFVHKFPQILSNINCKKKILQLKNIYFEAYFFTYYYAQLTDVLVFPNGPSSEHPTAGSIFGLLRLGPSGHGQLSMCEQSI